MPTYSALDTLFMQGASKALESAANFGAHVATLYGSSPTYFCASGRHRTCRL